MIRRSRRATRVTAIPARFVLERRDWKAAAQLEPSDATLPWANFPYAPATTYFAQALGAARVGELDASRAALRRLEAIHAGLQAAPVPGPYDWTHQIESARLAATAWLVLAEGRNDEALNIARAAADLEERTGKHPVTPGPPLPARELLGDMLLELNRPAEALAAYEVVIEQRAEPVQQPLRCGARGGAVAGHRACAHLLRRVACRVRRRFTAAGTGAGSLVRSATVMRSRPMSVNGRSSSAAYRAQLASDRETRSPLPSRPPAARRRLRVLR